jgi:hypothetical protein
MTLAYFPTSYFFLFMYLEDDDKNDEEINNIMQHMGQICEWYIFFIIFLTTIKYVKGVG